MSSDRPPFVLAFIADVQGCAYHRMMTPLASLYDAGVINGRYDQYMWPTDLGKAAKPDVVVWQRQIEVDQIKNMQEWREALPDALFVYELDDHLGDIPKASFHASFMPPEIEKRIAEGMVFCNRVTTTTEPMADWLRSLGGRDVRVVPNALPQLRLKDRQPRVSGKLRVGFAGGMSHTGDLELIRPAMEAIGEEVVWVFMGMQPDNPPCRTEFHDGQSVFTYMDAMAGLDCDLMLAPLEDNPFNLCKSNLRLVESGAICASVIAQDTQAYRLGDPPVFAYASTPDDWTRATKSFLAAKAAQRKENADAMMAWVGQKHTLERVLPRRMDAWLPDGERWRPRPPVAGGASPILAASDIEDVCERMPHMATLSKISDGLEIACRRALNIGTDVLWLRPATLISERAWSILRQLTTLPAVASIVPLAADGPNGFPQLDQWTLMPAETAAVVDDLCRENFRDRRLQVTAPSGPVVVLTQQALAMLGIPDVAGADGNEEQAILEWGLYAAKREWKHMQALDAYAVSLATPLAPAANMPIRMQTRAYGEIIQKPSERLTEDEREQLELGMIGDVWGGPRPGVAGFASDYAAWSALRSVQLEQQLPGRFGDEVSFRRYGGEDEAAIRSTDWIVWCEEKLELRDYAGWFFSDACRRADRSVDVVYADHESILPTGQRAPEFKPEFDRELFLAQDYITPICAVRRSALPKLPADKLDLFRAVLRISLRKGARGFRRLPHVLGGVPVDSSPESQALDVLARQVIIKEEMGSAVAVTAHKHIMGCLAVTHTSEATPKVSIIVPTLGGGRLIQPCVATILQHTAYSNFEVIVVQNGLREQPELLEHTRRDPRVRVVYYDGTNKHGFNWSRINNWAIREHVTGSLVLTLNDDCCVATKPWLTNMVGQLTQSDVGAVGARLLHPSGLVQHVGVICHNGMAGHMHKGLQNGFGGYLGRAFLTHEAMAVTGACMLFRLRDINRIGGFDENLAHNYADTRFCLELRKLGYRNVVEMSAELLHPEAASRESVSSPSGYKRLLAEGRMIAKDCQGEDPYWSPNLAIGISQNGVGFQGLNGESLAWTDFPAKVESERVLLVNDLPGTRGSACTLLINGQIPYFADLSGFQLKLSAPHTVNTQLWDIRRPEQIIKALRRLSIDRVVLCSLVGANGGAPPVETLRALSVVDRAISVVVQPHEEALITPFNDTEKMLQARNVFGFVDFNAWEAAYKQLVNGNEEGTQDE